MRRLGNTVIVVGLVLVAYAALWQLGVAPGSRVTLPAPMPLERRAATPTDVLATPVPAVAPTAEALLAVPTPAPSRRADAPDSADRRQAARRPPPGYAVRMAIPAIKLATDIQQGGIVHDSAGNPVWETLPFVAVHYGDLTSLIGAPGNAVIAGHVVTLREGNVFRFLYQLDIDDRIQVWDNHQREHEFHVVDVKLVPPTDVSVMAPTPDETLTLITCGGTFDSVTREFSDRLIVIAKPV